jgi:hypothetical protein
MCLRHKKFLNEGYCLLPLFFEKNKIKKLKTAVAKTRNFKKIFVSQKYFSKKQEYKGTNPRPGRNLAEKLDTNFIFSNKNFRKELEIILGSRCKILDYKFVVAVPNKIIPKWIVNIIDNDPIANMGGFIKEKYRDMTYFRGIDFHQDIIDYPDRPSDFITVYIYLDKVTNKTSPLYILKKSHLLGASIFPHNLKKIKNDLFEYRNDYNKRKLVKLFRFTGKAGSIYCWNSNLLHGTQPHNENKPRISMRILVEKNSAQDSKCLLDVGNKMIKGNLTLTKTRTDLTSTGKPKIKKNIIKNL